MEEKQRDIKVSVNTDEADGSMLAKVICQRALLEASIITKQKQMTEASGCNTLTLTLYHSFSLFMNEESPPAVFYYKFYRICSL